MRYVVRVVPIRIITLTVAAVIVCGLEPAGGAPVLDIASFQADDGVPLNALYWTQADRGKDPNPNKSLVLLIPGHIGSVFGGHDYLPLAKKLSEKGYDLLFPQLRAMNNWPYAVFDDVLKDIGGAVALAKKQTPKYERIALFGTSLGGPRIAFFMARKGDPLIRAVGFINSIMSPYLALQLSQSKLDNERLEALLEKARNLVVRGRGGTLVEYRDYFPGMHMAMTARSFISFNGREDESNAYSIKFAPKITVPALVIHGTADDIALASNPTTILASLSAAPKRDLVWIPNAGHFVTPQFAEAYAKEIVEWLVTNMPPQ
jgi:pimeloyl-ACP methyl ester carboxylesterase